MLRLLLTTLQEIPSLGGECKHVADSLHAWNLRLTILVPCFQLSTVQCTEPGVLMFKGESLQFRVALNPTTQQTLHLKATPLDGESPSNCSNPTYFSSLNELFHFLPAAFVSQWDSEELQYLERFFEVKVHVLHSFPFYFQSGSLIQFLCVFAGGMRTLPCQPTHRLWASARGSSAFAEGFHPNYATRIGV